MNFEEENSQKGSKPKIRIHTYIDRNSNIINKENEIPANVLANVSLKYQPKKR